MEMTPVTASNLRVRKSFANNKQVIDIPNLIELQKRSYEAFLQKELDPDRRPDTGLNELDVLNSWRQNGALGEKMLAFAAIDPVSGEVWAPVCAPFRLEVTFDRHHKLPDIVRQRPHPFVVRVGVIGRWRQQLDHGTK